MSATTLALDNSRPIVLSLPALPPVFAMLALPPVFAMLALPLFFGMPVGTGGNTTIDYVKMRGSKGYSFLTYDSDDGSSATSRMPSPADNLDYIRTVLKPSVTDLARALSVSRQAIYDWQAGRAIAAENAIRLHDMARAADLFAREGLQASPHVLRRSITNGKNLFDVVRDGGSAEASARMLIDIVRRELRQRESLRLRLAKRAPPTREEFRDLGTPMLDEKT
jgi:hypothetical protein